MSFGGIPVELKHRQRAYRRDSGDGWGKRRWAVQLLKGAEHGDVTARADEQMGHAPDAVRAAAAARCHPHKAAMCLQGCHIGCPCRVGFRIGNNSPVW